MELRALQAEDGLVPLKVAVAEPREGSGNDGMRACDQAQAAGVKSPVFGDGVGLAALDRGLAMVADHGGDLTPDRPDLQLDFGG